MWLVYSVLILKTTLHGSGSGCGRWCRTFERRKEKPRLCWLVLGIGWEKEVMGASRPKVEVTDSGERRWSALKIGGRRLDLTIRVFVFVFVFFRVV